MTFSHRYKLQKLVYLITSMVFILLPSLLWGQYSILDNPYQLDWVNKKIDALPTYDSSTLDFLVGHTMGDTLIQTREIRNDNIVRLETIDTNGITVQLCIESSTGMICEPDPTVILLEDIRTFWQAGEAIDCSHKDSLELLRFYWSFDGPQWDNTWDLSQPKGSWHDVRYHSNGCVKELIADDSIKGHLLDFYFPEIEEFRFGFTINLVDTIPDFQHMPELEVFSILGTRVHGKIPNFNHLPVLRLLSLRSSNLTGNIPNFEHLPNLKNLTLNGQQLTGEIPSFDHCPALRYVDFAENELEGPIPDFANHPDLIQLNIRDNNIMGAIPQFDNNPILQYLSLPGNQLSGAIPQFNNNPLLKTLSIEYNQITDTIPNFKNCPGLRTLWVGNNLLSGSIPSFANVAVEDFRCRDNLLSGAVPDFAVSCPTMVYCDISKNSLTFEDIVPTCAANDSTCISMFPQIQVFGYYYDDQMPIYQDTTLYKSVGDSLTIDLGIDETMDNSIYTWSKNDTILYTELVGDNTLQFQDLQISDSGEYKVEITNTIAPDLTLESRVITLVVDNTSPVNNVDQSTSMLYPNPTQDKLTIELSTGFQSGNKVSIYDIHGVLIKQQQITLDNTRIDFDCSDLIPGMYLIHYKNQDQLINRFFTKF